MTITLLQRSESEQQAMLRGWKWGTRWPLHCSRPCKDADDDSADFDEGNGEGDDNDDEDDNDDDDDVHLLIGGQTAIGAFRYK